MIRWLPLVLLACLVGHSTTAQTLAPSSVELARLVATYQLTYRPDSTQTTTRAEILYLLLGSTQSLFESRGKRADDSLLVTTQNIPFNQETAQLITTQMAALPHSRFSYTIYKTGVPRHLYYYDRIYPKHYRYEESAAPVWINTSATATIAGYTCQKATTTLGGRQWEAWFTREVPVSDGPYKFYGLPGLIVKVGDTRQNYVFELLRLVKPTAEYRIELPTKATTSTDRATFHKAKADYDRNAIEQMQVSGNIRFNTPAEAEDAKQRAHARAKSRNNPLELR